MNNKNYTVGWFINFFDAIPEELWCVDYLWNCSGQRCALGHAGQASSAFNHFGSPVVKALEALFVGFSPLMNGWDAVAKINNGRDPRYPQPTPKLRILAALRDIQRQQEEAAEAFELRPLNLSKPVQQKELA